MAVDDAYEVDEDAVLTVLAAQGVLANDTDVDNDLLTATLVNGPAHGTLVLAEDGSFVYTPEANFNGTDSFTYKATDGTLESNLATVTITVNPVNDWPVANDDEYEVVTGTVLEVAAPGVLGTTFRSILMSGSPSRCWKDTARHADLNNDGSFTTPRMRAIWVWTLFYLVLSQQGKGEE